MALGLVPEVKGEHGAPSRRHSDALQADRSLSGAEQLSDLIAFHESSLL